LRDRHVPNKEEAMTYAWPQFVRLLTALVAALALAACATTGSAPVSGTGVVQSINALEKPSTTASVVGTVGGALLGAWAGSQFGGGSGQTIATAAGGIGGSMAGSAAARNMASETVYDVTVQFDDGISRTVRVAQRPAVRPGARVRVENGVITAL
jgi:outer membrane lipoprotein SlyB